MFYEHCWLCTQADADYLRYHGLQEFDRAMHHLEETYSVSFVALVA